MKTNLTERKIQQHLSNFLSTALFYVNNLYVFNWESDKLIVTRSGYVYEFEIKISKADFKNDFKHKGWKHDVLQKKFTNQKYTERLYEEYENAKVWWNNTGHRILTIDEFAEKIRGRQGMFYDEYQAPNYFYYAVPDGMVDVSEIPDYAGLVYIAECGIFRIIKKAPKIHTEKFKRDSLNLVEKFHYNMWTWKTRAEDAEQLTEYIRQCLEEELQQKGQEKTYAQLKQELDAANDKIRSYQKRDDDIYYYQILKRMLVNKIKEYDPKFVVKEIEDKAEESFNKIYR